MQRWWSDGPWEVLTGPPPGVALDDTQRASGVHRVCQRGRAEGRHSASAHASEGASATACTGRTGPRASGRCRCPSLRPTGDMDSTGTSLSRAGSRHRSAPCPSSETARCSQDSRTPWDTSSCERGQLHQLASWYLRDERSPFQEPLPCQARSPGDWPRTGCGADPLVSSRTRPTGPGLSTARPPGILRSLLEVTQGMSRSHFGG